MGSSYGKARVRLSVGLGLGLEEGKGGSSEG